MFTDVSEESIRRVDGHLYNYRRENLKSDILFYQCNFSVIKLFISHMEHNRILHNMSANFKKFYNLTREQLYIKHSYLIPYNQEIRVRSIITCLIEIYNSRIRKCEVFTWCSSSSERRETRSCTIAIVSTCLVYNAALRRSKKVC